jgi:hypothetical protein
MKRLGNNLVLALVAISSLGCSSICATETCETKVSVAQDVQFVAQEPDGISPGFNLDEHVSALHDVPSCGHGDLISPEGTGGIDNQFSVLYGAVKELALDAIGGLIQGAIKDGTLLVMFKLDGVDDPMDDDCVDVSVFAGAGIPGIGTDGYITPGQTFDYREGGKVSVIECVPMKDRKVIAGPFRAVLPMQILDVKVDMDLTHAYVEITLNEDGTMRTVLGAAVANEELIYGAIEADQDYSPLIVTLVHNLSDME